MINCLVPVIIYLFGLIGLEKYYMFFQITASSIELY